LVDLVARKPVGRAKLGDPLAQGPLMTFQLLGFVTAFGEAVENCRTSAETEVPRSAATMRARR
jgi:hypothetical protein